jgi:uncharacterized protein YqeY
MKLKEKINSDYIEAFKAKNTVKKNLLSVIKSEIQTIEKNSQIQNLGDEDVIKILNKTSKSLKETLSLLSDSDKISSVEAELKLVESYLPKQLSVEEIQVKIDALVASGVNNIGQIMKEFSTLPADKKIVSELAKKSLV